MSALPLLRPPATHVALVADDDDDERALLAIVLRRVGFRVLRSARRGRGGLTRGGSAERRSA